MKVRRLAIDRQGQYVLYLHQNCPHYAVTHLSSFHQVDIICQGQAWRASLNIVSDEAILPADEIGLSPSLWQALPCRQDLQIQPAKPLPSVAKVKAKLKGQKLARSDYQAILQDIVAHRYSDIELTAFVIGAIQSHPDPQELGNLIRSMVATGEQLHWSSGLIVDKHCIGGVPGNRTSLIITPIVAAHGLTMPKTSSRAITSPAGTADTMEVLARVDLSLDEIKRVVARNGACLAWAGHQRLVPADHILIQVQRPLGVDAPAQIVASILAKKLAAGIQHLVLDIPVGTAKLPDETSAQGLKQLFEQMADHFGLQIKVLCTDGSQPIGRGIGPALEARDALAILQNQAQAPADLRQKALLLAGQIIEFDPQVPAGQGKIIAEQLLNSGQAWQKMQAIIQAQGEQAPLKLGAYHYSVLAPHSGTILSLNNARLAQIATLAGNPWAKGAGIDLIRKAGDQVQKGELLYDLYAESELHGQMAWQAAQQDCGYQIGLSNSI